MDKKKNIYLSQLSDDMLNLPPEDFSVIGTEDIKDEKFSTIARGFFKDALVRLRKNKAAVASFWILVMLILFAIFGPMMSGYTFKEQNLDFANMPARIPGLEKLGIFNGKKV